MESDTPLDKHVTYKAMDDVRSILEERGQKEVADEVAQVLREGISSQMRRREEYYKSLKDLGDERALAYFQGRDDQAMVQMGFADRQQIAEPE